MSQITFHQRPDGIFVEIPDEITMVRTSAIQEAITSFLTDRRRAEIRAMSLPDLLAGIVNSDMTISGLPLEMEELKRRVDGFSAHDRIRLGILDRGDNGGAA